MRTLIVLSLQFFQKRTRKITTQAFACLVISLLCLPLQAQIDVTFENLKSITGVNHPRQLGSRMVADFDSKPVTSDILLIKIVTNYLSPEVKAQKGLFEFITLEQASEGWILSEPGTYNLRVSAWNETAKQIVSRDVKVEFTTGPIVPPKPPIPPDPPGPLPRPAAVTNNYVGFIAYDKIPTATTKVDLLVIGTMYKTSANKLSGEGGLSDIVTIKTKLDADFDNYQTAAKSEWITWKLAVNQALKAEQVKRSPIGFTRKDWQAAFLEITTALESK